MGGASLNCAAGKELVAPGRRVLVVDDEEAIRNLLQQVLQEEAYEVVSAANGREAMTIFGREHFDLIIADIVMPEMDGVEMLLEAKHIQPKTPAIVVSGFFTEDTAQRLKSLGAAGYVAKPFQLDAIRHTIARAVERT